MIPGIGFDLDGVLFDWCSAARRLLVEATGIDRFNGDLWPEGPPMWDWLHGYGYSDEDIAKVIAVEETSTTFWRHLAPTEGAFAVSDRLVFGRFANQEGIETPVYFITKRKYGRNTKRQTEEAIRSNLGIFNPTVLIAEHKAPIVKALELTAFIEDKWETAVEIAETTTTRSYLLDRAYNRLGTDIISGGPLPRHIHRVNSVADFLDAEGLR